jgi:dTDP-4-amino-4,6-dideoxygalactose transaminase
LAAALTKQIRQSGLGRELDSALERTYVELFGLGERLADYTGEVRCASHITESLVQSVDYEAIAQRRVRNQQWLACQLEGKSEVQLLEPHSGTISCLQVPLLALPVLCEDRNQLRSRLATRSIFCAIEWVDGNWTGRAGEAAHLAAHVLSLPVDQRYEPDDLQTVVKSIS